MARLTTAAVRQLDSLYSISIEIARLHELPPVMDRALSYCLELTGSAFGFVGLLSGSLRSYLESGTHHGLKSMHRQVAAVGGSFEVSNGEESGLAVRARVPLPTS